MSQSVATATAELTAGSLQMSVLLSSDTPGLPRINCFNISVPAFSQNVDKYYPFKLKQLARSSSELAFLVF